MNHKITGENNIHTYANTNYKSVIFIIMYIQLNEIDIFT